MSESDCIWIWDCSSVRVWVVINKIIQSLFPSTRELIVTYAAPHRHVNCKLLIRWLWSECLGCAASFLGQVILEACQRSQKPLQTSLLPKEQRDRLAVLEVLPLLLQKRFAAYYIVLFVTHVACNGVVVLLAAVRTLFLVLLVRVDWIPAIERPALEIVIVHWPCRRHHQLFSVSVSALLDRAFWDERLTCYSRWKVVTINKCGGKRVSLDTWTHQLGDELTNPVKKHWNTWEQSPMFCVVLQSKKQMLRSGIQALALAC